MQRVLSCIQPTGDLHYGNYFGAVQNWVDLQKTYECLFGIVDYHAMTMPFDGKKLRQNTWDLAFNLMAVGVKAENLFIQSLVPEHAELSWIFNCFCSYGQLSRMTQFKEKSKSDKIEEGFVSSGLFTYPILQAADILIYKADFVPVGKDQEQHLELSRNIAQRFNNQIGKEYFVLPEPLFTETPKIMSTADPTRKMSKSAGDKHYIGLFDEPNKIRKQIKSAVTDSGEANDTLSPGLTNLFEILKACGNIDAHAHFMNDFKQGNLKYADLKATVGDALASKTETFREQLKEISANRKEVKNQIKQSSWEIRKKAQETIREVKDFCGLANVKM